MLHVYVSFISKCTLQVFYLDIAYVAVAIHVRCKCMSKYFTCFRPMLQVFHMDVAYVAMLHMFQTYKLQASIQNVSSVLDVCCKECLSGCCS
jgi:hypothetical protein